MRCHHYCNNPMTCWTCIVQFWAWVQARTNSPPRKGQVHNFYDHVNVIAPSVQVDTELR